MLTFKSPAAQRHWATAIVVLGVLRHIKTDNGSCFISRSTQGALGNISLDRHPWEFPGTSIVERANRLLKDKIRVLGEGEGHRGRILVAQQAEVLAQHIMQSIILNEEVMPQ